MPITWDKQTYDSMYRLPLWRWGVRGSPRVPYGHYTWFGHQGANELHAKTFIDLPGFAQVSDVVMIGGGFGWTAEKLVDHGINVINVEISPYVLAEKDQSEEQQLRDDLVKFGFDPDNLPVCIGPDYNTPVDPWSFWLRPDGKRTSITTVEEDMSTQASRQAVRSAISNNIDAIVTEFTIDSYAVDDDAGALQLIERCEQLRPNPAVAVIHMIQPNPSDTVLNVKTAQAWRDLLDANGYNHTVVDLKGNILTAGG